MTRPFMEELWDRIARIDSSGEKLVTYSRETDLDFLYAAGFVDTEAFTPAQWKEALKPFRQPDGSYRLKKNDFLTLETFRYKGPIVEPFDPLSLREGGWTEEELNELYTKTLKRESTITPLQWQQFLDVLRLRGEMVAGRFTITKSHKNQLKYLLNNYPSPLRRLEIRARKQRADKVERLKQAQTEVQTSAFKAGPKEEVVMAKRIADIEKVLIQDSPLPKKPKEAKIPLSQLKKSRIKDRRA